MSEYTMELQTEERGTRVVMIHTLPEGNGQVIEFPFDVPSEAKVVALRVCEIALASLNSDNARGIKWQAGYAVDNKFALKPTIPYDVPFMIRWPEQDDGSKWISLSWVYGPDDTAITMARDEACLILNLWIDQLK
jgi:hypothetical protein